MYSLENAAISTSQLEEFLNDNNIGYDRLPDGTYYVVIPANSALIVTPSELVRTAKINTPQFLNLSYVVEHEGQKMPITCKPLAGEEGIKFAIGNGIQRYTILKGLNRDIKIVLDRDFDLVMSSVLNVAVAQSKAETYKSVVTLIDKGASFETVARRLNLKSDEVENYFGLSTLPENIRTSALHGQLSMASAVETVKVLENKNLTKEQKDEIVKHVSGQGIDPASKAPLPPATVLEIRNLVKTFKAKNKKELMTDSKPDIIPEFTFKPELNQARMEEQKTLYFQLLEKIEADWELSDDEKQLVNVFNYLYNYREEDRQTAYTKYRAMYNLPE